MTLPTQAFRDEHAGLITHVEHVRQAAAEVPRLSIEERTAIVARVANFLRNTLLPHAAAEEQVLYPAWAQLVGSADAASAMVHDHEAIAARTHALSDCDPADADRLQELLYGLYALISVHFAKEEEIQLPILDAHPDVAEEIVARLQHAHHKH